MSLIHRALGTALDLRARGERGLSQSTEQAILLAAAVTVALLIVAAVTTLVQSKIGQIKA